jgi:hypothetical protein
MTFIPGQKPPDAPPLTIPPVPPAPEVAAAVTALAEGLRAMATSIRAVVNQPGVVEIVAPILLVLKEMSVDDRYLYVAAMLLASTTSVDNVNGAATRIALIPVDVLAREAWGVEPACTTFEDLLEEYEGEDEEDRDATQLANLRADVERLRGLFLRAALGLPLKA